nr:MAG TPA: transcription factor E2-alpha [Caudoviricetes sp.]
MRAWRKTRRVGTQKASSGKKESKIDFLRLA